MSDVCHYWRIKYKREKIPVFKSPTVFADRCLTTCLTFWSSLVQGQSRDLTLNERHVRTAWLPEVALYQSVAVGTVRVSWLNQFNVLCHFREKDGNRNPRSEVVGERELNNYHSLTNNRKQSWLLALKKLKSKYTRGCKMNAFSVISTRQKNVRIFAISCFISVCPFVALSTEGNVCRQFCTSFCLVDIIVWRYNITTRMMRAIFNVGFMNNAEKVDHWRDSVHKPHYYLWRERWPEAEYRTWVLPLTSGRAPSTHSVYVKPTGTAFQSLLL